jgi:tripartite-type tricarboxylate transporter receptor subunit TctC
MYLKRIVARVAASFFLALAASAAAASSFPDGPVRIILPFTPGGGADLVVRLLAQKLEARWGQRIVIDYAPGAAGVIATEKVLKSAPDGKTLGLVVTSHVINPSTKKLPYDTLKDSTGVTQLATIYVAMLANKDSKVQNIADLIAYSKANPGKVTYGTTGYGSMSHLFGELFNSTAGTTLVPIAYQGSGPARTDLLGGHIEFLIDSLASEISLVEAKSVKLLALTSPKRVPEFKNFPVVSETVPGLSAESFFGIIAPAATPKATVTEIHKAVKEAVASEDVRAKMLELGLTPVGSSPDEFNALIRTEIAKWAKVIKDANIEMK